MQIIPKEDVSVLMLKDWIMNDALIIMPFDTCYGLVCNPLSPKAVQKLLSYKARREGKAISVAVDSLETAEQYCEINLTAKDFIMTFLPGLYTVVVKSKGLFAPGIEAENGSVGMRIPDGKFPLKFLKEFRHPITSTSANQSYQKTPYQIKDILDTANEENLKYIDIIIDGGKLEKTPPSTVIDTTNESIHILRKGSIIPQNAKTNEFASDSVEATIKFGEELMQKFQTNLEYRPVIFALQGDMGAGKTHFTKGIAKALGIEKEIQSPTFILSMEYKLDKGNTLYHIDTWRLENNEDEMLKELGINQMLDAKPEGLFNVIVIEWAEKVESYLRSLDKNIKIIWVKISGNEKTNRVIRWSE